jgi:WD40 repeat protein
MDRRKGGYAQEIFASPYSSHPRCVRYSPDGKLLAVTGIDGTKLYDSMSGRELRSIGDHFTSSVEFSPNGRFLTSNGLLSAGKLWDVSAGKELLALHGSTGNITSAAFSPDSRLIAIVTDRKASVWDVVTGKELDYLNESSGGLHWGVFSPDGHSVALAGLDTPVKVWHIASFKGNSFKAQTLGARPVFSSDGRRLAWSGSENANVIDAMTGQELFRLEREAGDLGIRSLSCDGKIAGVAVAKTGTTYSEELEWEARVWDSSTKRAIFTHKIAAHESSGIVRISPDGKHLAMAVNVGRAARFTTDWKVRVWEVTTGKEFPSVKVPIRDIDWFAFSPDGNRLAVGGGWYSSQMMVLDVLTGRQVLSLQTLKHLGRIVFSPNGQRLAVISGSDVVRVIDAITGGQALEFKAYTDVVTDLEFSPDGKRLVTSDLDGMIKLWEASTGRELLSLKLPSGNFVSYDVRFTADGQRLVAAGSDGTVHVWETESPPEQVQLERKVTNLVNSLFFELVRKKAVIERISGDAELDDRIRKLALARADSLYRDPDELNRRSRHTLEAVQLPAGRSQPAAYQRALLEAQEACELAPNNGSYLNTLGMALYRVEQYQQALDTLMRSDQINAARHKGSTPADLAFLAMAYQRLGSKAKAREELARLRETMKNPRWINDPQAQAFQSEAEALLKDSKPAGK